MGDMHRLVLPSGDVVFADISFYPPELPGLAVRLRNGLTVSLRWGGHSYSSSPTIDDRAAELLLFGEGYPPVPRECEVAVRKGDGFVTGWPGCSDHDVVSGWLSHDEIWTILAWAVVQA